MKREIVKVGNKFEKIAKQDEESIVSTIIGGNVSGQQMSRLLNAGEKFRKDKVLPSYFVKGKESVEIASSDSEKEEVTDLKKNFRHALRKKLLKKQE